MKGFLPSHLLFVFPTFSQSFARNGFLACISSIRPKYTTPQTLYSRRFSVSRLSLKADQREPKSQSVLKKVPRVSKEFDEKYLNKLVPIKDMDKVDKIQALEKDFEDTEVAKVDKFILKENVGVNKSILLPTPPSKSLLKPQVPAPQKKPIEKPKPVHGAPKRTFKERSSREEFEIMYKFLTKGIDLEDIKYFKVAYNLMLEQQDAPNNMSKMLNYTHWVDHTVTDIPGTPPKKKRKFDFSKPHLTGSARSEGYYKMDPREKARTKYHLQRDTNAAESSGIVNTQGAMTKAKIQSAQNMSREARSNQRRQLAVLGDEASSSDLLKFNQLKVFLQCFLPF